MNKYVKKLICMLLVIASLMSLGLVPASAAESYTDVTSGNWFYSAVNEAGDYGIMGGYGNGKFGPNDKLTREQFVKILASVAEVDMTPYKSVNIGATFSDVPSNSWYAPYVAWAYENNITSGVSAGKFGTGNPVTREQVAKFIITFVDTLGYTLDESEEIIYSDMASVSSWAVESVSAISKTGLFKGDDQKRYNPTSGITRAETATVMVRLIKQIDANSADDHYILGIKADKAAGTVKVRAFSAVNARLKLQVLSEDKTSVIASDTLPVRTVSEAKDVTFSFGAAALPEYFVLVATLYDRNGNALTDPFTSIHYTKAYEEFASRTVNDFPEERVINLDESINNNYVVVTENTVVLAEGRNATVVSENADKTVFSVKGDAAATVGIGDKVIIETKDGAYPIVAQSVSYKNGAYQISGTPGDRMEDFFSTIRIGVETVGKSGDEARLMSDDRDSEIYLDAVMPIELGSIEGDFKLGPVSVGASFSGTDSLHLIVEWDVVLFGPDYIFFALLDELDYETSMSIGIGGSGDIDIFKLVGLGTSEFPEMIKKYVNLSFEVVVGISIEVEGKASVNCTGTLTAGFIYQKGSGIQKIKTVENTATTNLEAECEIRIGPRVSLNAKMGDIVDASVEFFSGAVVEAKLAENLGTSTNADKYHACELCLEGELSAQMTLTMNCEVFGKSELEEKGDFINNPLGDFYVSIINESQSIHQGKLVFNKGVCPNFVYRTTYYAKDSDGKTSDALITAPDKSADTILLSSGQSTYLYPGSYSASAEIEGENISKQFTVKDSSQSVTLEPEKITLLVRVKDNFGNPVPGALITVSGGAVFAGVVDENGVIYEKYKAVKGPVTITASAPDYTSASEGFNLQNSMKLTLTITKNDWLDAYIKVLDSQRTNGYFLLAYIDNDDIPELLYSPHFSHVAFSELYGYKDGSLINYGSIGDFGELNFAVKTGKIYANYFINGYGLFSTFYDISDGTLRSEKDFEEAYVNNKDTYAIDGVSVSQASYKAELAKWSESQDWIYFGYNSKGSFSLDSGHKVLNELRADYTKFLYK